MAISLVLVDDHPFLIEGLEQLLGLDPEFVVLGKCGTAAEGLRAVETLRPDVLILDLQLREGDGFTVLRELACRRPPAVIVLTATENEEDLLEAVRLGARGVVLKAMAPRTLEESIRVVHGGGEWLNVEGQNLADRLARREIVERSVAERLTSREVEVLRLLASQYENDEIARRLGLTTGTVKIHVHHVYRKLGVSGRQELMGYLKREGY
jgi:DNA-binding NarL/FixJ family response regulator